LVRQDLLDQIVWSEVIRLLEDPTLIQQSTYQLAAGRLSSRRGLLASGAHE
jgi:hypothetical protein